MVTKLCDVCDVRDGTHDSPQYVLEGYPLVTSKNIIDGKLNLSTINYISKEDYYKNLISLPLHTCLSDDDVEYVCKALKTIISKS